MGKYKNWEKAAFWSADTDEGRLSKEDSFQMSTKLTVLFRTS